jgi:glycosyltransferase involved in cell wall biosynthesis
MTDLVSVGLPVYNGGAFLERALRSLREQDYEPLEILVSDNASTDETEAVCRDAAGADPRIRYERADRNRGAAWNYVNSFRMATGTYFKWAAHDDLCRPTLVSACVAALEADQHAVVAYPRTALIDLDDQPVADFYDGLELLEDTPVARLARLLAHQGEYHPVFGVMRREALACTSVMGAYLGADIVVVAELALQGRIAEVPERLFLRRYHDGTSMRANPDLRARAAWFDPDRRWRMPMPATRLAGELLRAVARAELDPGMRARCAGVVLRHWGLPRWRDIGGELKLAARTAVSR